jgi:hypothetical protein
MVLRTSSLRIESPEVKADKMIPVAPENLEKVWFIH